MSKKNKNRQQKPAQASSPPSAQSQPTSVQSQPTAKENGRGIWGWVRLIIGPAIVTAINGAVTLFSYQQVKVARESVVLADKQLQVARETLDRSTGKLAAKFDFADYYPKQTDFREDQLIALFGQKDAVVPCYRDVNSLVLMPPTFFLNNTGTEAIEALRVETSFLGGIIDRRGEFDMTKPPPLPPPDWHKTDTPVGLRKVEREEHMLPEQWKPGESLKLPVLKGVLGQLMEHHSRTAVDKVHSAQLRVSVSARLTGSSVFNSDGTSLVLRIVWIPKGFSEEECNRVRQNYQPKLEIAGPVPVRIPRD